MTTMSREDAISRATHEIEAGGDFRFVWGRDDAYEVSIGAPRQRDAARAREVLCVTDKGIKAIKSNARRTRSRKFVWVELTPAERAKLERLRDARGERATLAGVIRELLAKEHDLPIDRPAADAEATRTPQGGDDAPPDGKSVRDSAARMADIHRDSLRSLAD